MRDHESAGHLLTRIERPQAAFRGNDLVSRRYHRISATDFRARVRSAERSRFIATLACELNSDVRPNAIQRDHTSRTSAPSVRYKREREREREREAEVPDALAT